MAVAVMWFRRDLRLQDHGALAAAAGDQVVPLFVLDPILLDGAGPVRRDYLFASLSSLDASLREQGGALVVRTGDPVLVLPQVAREFGAEQVMVSGDYAPYGLRRDAAVAAALADSGVAMRALDTPYLHPPGTVRKSDGSPFAVFTPFSKVWTALPVPSPAVGEPTWVSGVGDPVPHSDTAAGEALAVERATAFLSGPVQDYGSERNRTDLPGTSGLSAALHFGEIHPRTVLALAAASGLDAAAFIRQLCWRDFYADVLHRRPEVAWRNFDTRYDALPWQDDDAAFDAWAAGRTGYPMVDAGMRQLLAEGWMHNRTRMLVASFLTKDLLIPWQRGARWFLRHLRDGDVANNSLGWQWSAGMGIDPAPYYRVFNPVLQGKKFDPAGDYVRRYVPELRHLPGATVHEPWDAPSGYDHGYPHRMVDHAEARKRALAAYDFVRTPVDD